MATSSSPRSTERIADLRNALEPLADEANATQMAAYMKDQFPFLGIKAQDRRQAQRPTINALKGATGDELVGFATACWLEPEREFQYAAADALRKHARALASVHLDEIKALISTKAWWDTVDALAVHVVGPMVAADHALDDVMDQWIENDDLWLARTAILHQLMYKDDTDADRLFAYADKRAEDTEFFIRKALGWAMRQYARTNPEAVRRYVAANDDRLSGLTKREALKHL